MTNFNYKPMYPTRKATESHIEVLNDEILAVGTIDGASIGPTTALSIMRHLQAMRDRLKADLKYFDAIDRAMEEAVK